MEQLTPLFRLERAAYNPFVIIDLAVKSQLADLIWDAFIEAFGEVESLAAELKYYIQGELNTVDINRLQASFSQLLDIETESGAEFLQRYLNNLTNVAPHIGSDVVDILSFQQKIIQIAEIRKDKSITHTKYYRLNWKQERFHFDTGALCLLPFLDLYLEPVKPLTKRQDLESMLKDILTDDEPVDYKYIDVCLLKRGVEICQSYLEFIFLNSPEFLRLEWGGRKINLADEVLNEFGLAAWGLNPDNFIKTNGLSYKDKGSLRAFDVDVDSKILKTFFKKKGNERFLECVNFEEVAVKLRDLRRLEIRTIQGLPVRVFNEVVNCLDRQHKALTVPQICQFTAIEELPLVAEDLPPGRIMAYAPGPRFMNRESMRYVLREWVQDEGNWKGKISKTRVISPKHNINIDFKSINIPKMINDDVTLRELGVLSSYKMAFEIAKKVDGAPTDPYHLKIIRSKVEAEASNKLDSIGKGLFADPRHRELIREITGTSKKRRLIARKVLGVDYNLQAEISSLPIQHQETVLDLLK